MYFKNTLYGWCGGGVFWIGSLSGNKSESDDVDRSARAIASPQNTSKLLELFVYISPCMARSETSDINYMAQYHMRKH
jgi:hypothetical protein